MSEDGGVPGAGDSVEKTGRFGLGEVSWKVFDGAAGDEDCDFGEFGTSCHRWVFVNRVLEESRQFLQRDKYWMNFGWQGRLILRKIRAGAAGLLLTQVRTGKQFVSGGPAVSDYFVNQERYHRVRVLPWQTISPCRMICEIEVKNAETKTAAGRGLVVLQKRTTVAAGDCSSAIGGHRRIFETCCTARTRTTTEM